MANHSTRNRPWRNPWLARAFLFASILVLVAGYVLPMMSIDKFVVFSNEFSLLQAIFRLPLQGEWLLFLILLLFTLVLPLGKVVFLLLMAWNRLPATVHSRWHRLLALASKWAMLDVMVVALLVVTVKLGVLASVTLYAGAYCFAVGVIMLTLAAEWLTVGHKTLIRTAN